MYKQELQKGSTPEGGKDKVYRVTIEHVKQALDEFKSSPAINSTQMASKFEKIFLCALLRDRKITGNSLSFSSLSLSLSLSSLFSLLSLSLSLSLSLIFLNVLFRK